MEIDKVDNLVKRIDQLQKFADKINDLKGRKDSDVVLQIHKTLTDDQFNQIKQDGKGDTVFELIDENGDDKYEMAIARAEVNFSDIAPVLGDLVSHCLMKSKDVYEELKKEVEDE